MGGRSRRTQTSPVTCTRTRASTGEQRSARGQEDQPGPAAGRPDRSSENRNGTHWFAPIVADAEAGFGGALNVFELMKGMIEAGAAGVHFEDQLASEKKCGHMGGKVLLPTAQAVRNLISARLAADVMGVPTVIVARTDADGADLITSDVDPTDAEFLTGERTMEGFYRDQGGLGSGDSPRAIVRTPTLTWCGARPQAGPRAGAAVRRGHPRDVPRQATRVQLLALLQLEAQPLR